jgi:hypothetical protein
MRSKNPDSYADVKVTLRMGVKIPASGDGGIGTKKVLATNTPPGLSTLHISATCSQHQAEQVYCRGVQCAVYQCSFFSIYWQEILPWHPVSIQA